MRFPWVAVRGKVVVLLSVTFSDRLERKRERLNRINSFRAKDESGTESISSQVVVSVLSLMDMAKASRAYTVVDSCCQS